MNIRIPTKTVELVIYDRAFDVEFLGSTIEDVELVSVKTSSGDSITGLLEHLLTGNAIPVLTYMEQQLVNHLSETGYFTEEATNARDAFREREY